MDLPGYSAIKLRSLARLIDEGVVATYSAKCDESGGAVEIVAHDRKGREVLIDSEHDGDIVENP
jgi:putative hemolysin